MATTILRFESGSYVVYRTIDLVAPATGASDGVQEVDLLSLYEVDPGTAEILDELSKIGSDNWLSKGEKPRVIAEWTAVQANLATLTARAAALVVDSTGYSAAVANLQDYLVNHIPGWSDTRYDTELVIHSPYSSPAATWQGLWSSVYSQETSLLAALAAVQPVGGTNLVRNSSFEFDLDNNGVPDGFQLYNSNEAASLTREAGGLYDGYFTRITWAVNAAWPKGVTSSSSLFFRTKPCGVIGGWRTAIYYVFSVWARASGTNIGKYLGLDWITSPQSGVTVINNPPLTTDWQRYAFRVRWDPGATPNNSWFLSISGSNSGGVAACGTQGQLDLDAIQIEEGILPSAYGPAPSDTQDAADAANATAAAAATMANGRNRIFYGAARPDEYSYGIANGAPLLQGDMWMYKTLNIRNAAGVLQTRFALKVWNASLSPGVAWEDMPLLQFLVAGEILAGEITADKLQANSLQTTNYRYTGTLNDITEVCTSGARMRRNSELQQGAVALLVDPNGIKIGSRILSEAWLGKFQAFMCRFRLYNTAGTLYVEFNNGYNCTGATITYWGVNVGLSIGGAANVLTYGACLPAGTPYGDIPSTLRAGIQTVYSGPTNVYVQFWNGSTLVSSPYGIAPGQSYEWDLFGFTNCNPFA